MRTHRHSGIGHALEAWSGAATQWTGSAAGFAVAALVVIVWAVSGPIFGFSNSWQLVINTGTTIVTFLMVFLIQRAQNKESMALQLKLNEIMPPCRAPAIAWWTSKALMRTSLRLCGSSIRRSAAWPRAGNASRSRTASPRPSSWRRGRISGDSGQPGLGSPLDRRDEAGSGRARGLRDSLQLVPAPQRRLDLRRQGFEP